MDRQTRTKCTDRRKVSRLKASWALALLVLGFGQLCEARKLTPQLCRRAMAGYSRAVVGFYTSMSTCHQRKNEAPGQATGSCNTLSFSTDPSVASKWRAALGKATRALDRHCELQAHRLGEPLDPWAEAIQTSNYGGVSCDDRCSLRFPIENILADVIRASATGVVGSANLGGDGAKSRCVRAVARAQVGIVHEILAKSTRCQAARDASASSFGALDPSCRDSGQESTGHAMAAIAKACAGLTGAEVGTCDPLPACAIDETVAASKVMATALYTTVPTSPCGGGSDCPTGVCEPASGTMPPKVCLPFSCGDAAGNRLESDGGICRPLHCTVLGNVTLDLGTGAGTGGGTAECSDLGTFTVHVTFASFNPSAEFLVAPNGDKVFLAPTTSPEGLRVTTITGGTGRFVYASGVFTTTTVSSTVVSVVGNTLMGEVTNIDDGWISSGGSGQVASLDPTARGPYGVGSTRVVFTRRSSTSDTERVLDAVIWYPIAVGATGSGAFADGERDAPIAQGGPFPLLVFSHRACGLPEASSFLTAHLATYGFVVAAPPHPGNTLTDGLCSSPSSPEILDSFLNRPDDISFAIDRMLDLGGSAGGFFGGKMDPLRVGVLGHSFGGQTTLRVAAADARVRGVLVLGPGGSTLVLGAAAKIQAPTMIQGGALDSLAPFESNQQAVFDVLPSLAYLVRLENTGHFAFSNLCPRGTEPGFPGVSFPECEPGTLTQDDAHALVRRFAVPFLELVVAGDERWAPLLYPPLAPAGSTVEVKNRF